MGFSTPGGESSNKAGKAAADSSPNRPSANAPKPLTCTLYVNGPENYARMQHSFVKGEGMKALAATKREVVDAQVAFLHEKQVWDSSEKKAVDNPRYRAKYEGLCNLDSDGAMITNVKVFCEYINTNIFDRHKDIIDSVTFFLLPAPGQVPAKWNNAGDFFTELEKYEFPAEGTPDVLSRLKNLEEWAMKMDP